MSTNLLQIIRDVLKAISTSSIGKPNIQLNATVVCIAGGVHAVYAYGTSKTEEVTIINKYQIVNHGSTRFMIHDDKGRHYAVNNSLWYWKWDSIEDWSGMYKGDRIKVHYYGIRSPLFGLFPNIVGVETEFQPRKWAFE